jgi:hypothetical protein
VQHTYPHTLARLVLSANQDAVSTGEQYKLQHWLRRLGMVGLKQDMVIQQVLVDQQRGYIKVMQRQCLDDVRVASEELRMEFPPNPEVKLCKLGSTLRLVVSCCDLA